MFKVVSEFGSGNWHIGESKPFAGKVFSLTADCDELDYIKNNFANIPFCYSKRLIIWRGDIAQFIYDNL